MALSQIGINVVLSTKIYKSKILIEGEKQCLLDI